MRSTLRIAALALVLVALLVPLAGYASGGPCPDDPELSKECVNEAPPFYVVINRSFEDLTRSGTGCQPIILKHPECKNCCEPNNRECAAASADVEARVCPLLAGRVAWDTMDTVIVYEMCCNCAQDPNGVWKFRVRELRRDGSCPISEQNPACYEGLPPGTGIDLPAPVIIGALAGIGVALVATGVAVRRKSLKLA